MKMKNFGLIKSKIEKLIIESYKKNTFQNELKTFKKLVLENKNIGKLFYLYDELSTNKGLSNEFANQFINESITIYENTVNKIDPKQFNEINKWVSKIEVENQYKNIDGLFNSNILEIENKVNCRNIIIENLNKETKKNTNNINLPISSMLNVANKTLSNFIEQLNESDKKELNHILKSDESKLKEDFVKTKEDVISKLQSLIENNQDNETKQKISETITKISSESFDRLSYYKLKSLKESL